MEQLKTHTLLITALSDAVCVRW